MSFFDILVVHEQETACGFRDNFLVFGSFILACLWEPQISFLLYEFNLRFLRQI